MHENFKSNERQPGDDSPMDIDSLSKKYGSIDDIPDEELGKINWERYAPGCIRAIEPLINGLERITEGKERAKRENQPFVELSFGAEVLSSVARRVPAALMGKLNKIFDQIYHQTYDLQEPGEYEEFTEIVSEYKNSGLDYFRKLFSDFIEENLSAYLGEINPDQPRNFSLCSNHFLGTFFSGEHLPSLIEGLTADYFEIKIEDYKSLNGDREEYISKEKSQELSLAIDRSQGKLLDPQILQQALKKIFQGDFIDSEGGSGLVKKWIPGIEDYCQKNNLVSRLDVAKHFFVLYLKNLKNENFFEITEKLSMANSLEEIQAIFKTQKSILPDALLEKQKEAKNAMKTATINEKISLSGQLKNLEQDKNHYKKLMMGLDEFFSCHEMAAIFFHRKIKEVRDFLTGKAREKESLNFYLNAAPDLKYDKDPGKTSGDCTEGRPLPFSEKGMLLYNVKVFRDKRERSNEKEHVGNIYLFVTKEAVTGAPVWHLDAIQVPLSSIDVDSFLEETIEKMAEAANKKGIDYISVNKDAALISNHDYIREAVIKFIEEKNFEYKEIFIEMPSEKQRELFSSKDFSNLQGWGEDMVLWKRDKKKSD